MIYQLNLTTMTNIFKTTYCSNELFYLNNWWMSLSSNYLISLKVLLNDYFLQMKTINTQICFILNFNLKIGKEPWSSGIERRLETERSWVQIRTPDTRWNVSKENK